MAGSARGRRARGAWQRLGSEWRLALWLLIALRLSLEVVGILAFRLRPARSNPPSAWLDLVPSDGEIQVELVSIWQRWDALWYQQIATHGYAAGDRTTAFFPLYPLLVRVASWPLGGHIVLAELVVSSAAFLLAMGLLYRVAGLDVSPPAARLTVLLVALFPTGFYLLAPYTDGLFLVLTLATFWLARRGRLGLAGAVAFAAALTRAQGVLLALPLACEHLRQQRAVGQRPSPGLLAAALPLIGFAALQAYFHFVVGEPGTALDVQRGFGVQVSPPWEVLMASWSRVVSRPDPIEALNLGGALGFALLACAVRRLPLSYAFYTWPSLGLPLSRLGLRISPLAGSARYVLVLFPCFIVLALLLTRHPRLAVAWLVASLLLQLLLFQHWVTWGFVD